MSTKQPVYCTLMVAVLLTGCDSAAPSPNGFPGLSIGARCTPPETIARYVDEQGRFAGERGPVESAFHAGVLSHAGQPALACIENTRVAYRFVRTLALDRVDLVVLVSREKTTDRALLTTYNRETKQTSSKELVVNETQWRRIEDALVAIDFWNQPANEMPSPNRPVALDGGSIAIEGFTKGRYHIVIRPVDNKLSEAAQVFLDALEVSRHELR